MASKRFAIRSNRTPLQKQGSTIIYGTGDDVPFAHTCQLFCKRISPTEFEYVTGLEPKHIRYSTAFTDEEKDVLIKQQTNAVKLLADIHGKDTLKSTNGYFWEEKSSFTINNETLVTFFDTKEPEHLLLYWKIVGGGYDDEIAPSHEAAQQRGLSFYLTEFEEEAERQSESIGHKVKAFSLLEELNERKSGEDMLWMSWMLHPSNMGYTKATPKAVLYKNHYEFINGDLVKGQKKACSKQFIDAFNLLKADKTRAIATALVRAGDYFGLIFSNKDGKFETRAGKTILGADVEEAIETLLRPINQQELELLREEVEEKIK